MLRAMDVPQQESRGPGSLSIFQVLVSPGAVFDRILVRPTVLAPLLVTVVASIVVAAVMSFRIDWVTVLREQTQKQWASSPQSANLPEEQKEKILESLDVMAKVMPVIMIGGALIVTPLVTVAVTALFWVLFKLVAGSDWSFLTALSATLHGMAPGLVAGLALIVVMLAADPSSIDVEDPLRSHLGAFADKEEVGMLAWSLLSSVEFFGLWRVALMTIGFARTSKASVGTSAGIVIACWLVYVLGKVLLLMARTGFQGAPAGS